MENHFYVYAHHVPGDETPFYIGKGRGDRAWHSTPGKRNRWWRSYVEKHCPDGPEVRIVASGLNEQEAFALEARLIAHYGRRDKCPAGRLINLTDGGDGPTGVIRSQEYREAVSRRAVPEWVRQRMSAGQMGKKRPKTQEHCDKLSMSRVSPVMVVDPQGAVHVVQNRSAFAKQHGLKSSGLFNLISGKLGQHHGWTRFSEN